MYTKVDSGKKIHNMQTMQKLPTNMPNFTFNPTVNFYNTTYVARYSSVVFTNNISL